MHPIDFPEGKHIFAEHQPEYQRLPTAVSAHTDGCTASCWKLTWRERLRLLFTGRLWIEQLTFHRPLQPIRPSVDKPDFSTYGYEE